ncbi:MAG TPA: hypothetical protein VD902_16055, partial [Symbiobacteriaceae bacterium]|nr:hypothetical protein [Symbiobacteriaceae bacterium]
VVEAVLRNDIDVITHPGHLLDIDTAELARACAMRGTALEISARHREMTAEFCRLAAREGALFVISSDAHSPCDVGDVARGLAVAKAAGLTPAQVLNVEGGALFEWLERKRARRARQSGWEDWAAQPALDRAGRAATPGGPRREEEGQERRRSYWTDWSSQGKIH